MMSMGQPKFLISMSHIHTDRHYRQTGVLKCPRILKSSHSGCPMLIILRVYVGRNDQVDFSEVC